MDRCGCSMAAEFIETRCSLIVRTVGASDDKNFPFPISGRSLKMHIVNK